MNEEVTNTIKVGSKYRHYSGLIVVITAIEGGRIGVGFPCEDEPPAVVWGPTTWFSDYLDNGVRVYTLIEPDIEDPNLTAECTTE